MLCEKCKEREATIFYTEIINGVKSEHSLCSECAKDMEFGDEMPFAELLSGILGAYAGAEMEKRQDAMEQVICPTCKLTYREFIKKGIFGCEDCYAIFEPLIRENIKKIQGNNEHLGKKPLYNPNIKQEQEINHPMNSMDEIAVMKERLQEALHIEDYEEAAKLRDGIRALQKKEGLDA